MEPLSANDPRTVGEFQLHALLGSGGMGRVYLGFSQAGRAVAVKVVHPQLARDHEFIRRFRQEIAAARAVSGIYTAPVVSAGLDDDPPWLATVFVPGPSLATVISSRGPLPEEAAWRLAAGLAEALQAVHACGLVHRDLKPANVLLAVDGPHVIDFGISRAFNGTTLTARGMVVGTPGFMSPEQASGAQVGPASDVFSLGCVLAYAATGFQPFGEGSAPAVLYRVVSGQPNLATIPSRLRDIVAACLGKDPAGRPGLGALAATISRDAPAVAASPTSFWPSPLAEAIRRYQAESGFNASFAMATAASQVATQVPAAGGPHYPGGPPWVPQSAAVASNQPGPAGAWPERLEVPYQPAPARPAPPAATRPRIPGSVLTAVRLMYAGAAVSLVSVVVSLGAINQIKTSFEVQHPLAQNVAQGVAALAAAAVIISGAVAIGVWLKLASASRKGRSWARTAGTILFVLDTLALLGTLGRAGIPVTKTFGVLTWLIGLIAVISLWRRQSSAYFDDSRRR